MSGFLSLISVSDYFGFGLMNAEQMVTRSLNWTLVATRLSCASGTILTGQ